MREISPEEKAFIDKTLQERESIGSAKLGKTVKKRKKTKKVYPWQKTTFWAGFILLIPTVLSTLFIINLMRVQSIIGNETVRVLTNQNLPEQFKEEAAANGFEWLPQFIELEKNKELIIGGMFTVAIVIILAMFFIETLIKRHKARKENG